MADYYTQFSLLLGGIPEEDYPFFRELSDRIEKFNNPEYEGDEELCFDFELLEEEGSAWFHSDDGEPSHVAAEVQKYLQVRGQETSVEFYWANTCSKPRPDGFSGGACLITAFEIFWFIPYQQVQNKLDDLSAEHPNLQVYGRT